MTEDMMLKDFSAMTEPMLMAAYEATSDRFELTGSQRNKLDVDPMYAQIMFAAHNSHWITVECLLKDAGIL